LFLVEREDILPPFQGGVKSDSLNFH